MAIELIPKSEERKSLVVSILFYFALILVLATIFCYFVFSHLEKKNSKNTENLTAQITSMKTQERREAEQNLLKYQKKINLFSQLLKNHKFLLNFFSRLGNISHPMAYFDTFSLDVKELKVTISGRAENFPVVGQQLLMLKKADFIKNVNLLGISMGEEGGALFSFEFSLLPEIFEYKEPKPEPIIPAEEEIETEEETETET